MPLAEAGRCKHESGHAVVDAGLPLQGMLQQSAVVGPARLDSSAACPRSDDSFAETSVSGRRLHRRRRSGPRAPTPDDRNATKAIAGNGTNRHDRNGDFSA
jgi:hypothetical protein